MALAAIHRVAQDALGNALQDIVVEVRAEASGTPLAQLYSDRDGNDPLGNPLAWEDGSSIDFYLDAGVYKITVSKSGEQQAVERYVVAMADVAGAGGAAALVERTYTDDDISAGAVTLDNAADIHLFDLTVAADINIMAQADRDGVAITLKDVSGNAATNNLTPVFDGSETCDGLDGSAFALTTNYAWVTFKPAAGGWYQL